MRLLTKIKQIKNSFRYWFVRHIPIKKDKIVFENFCGKGYGGRPKIIAEELIKQKIKAKMVWVSYKKPEDLPKEIEWVEYDTPRALCEWASAHIWIDNVRNAKHSKKRKGQYYIQTWHGLPPGVKKVEGEIPEAIEEGYVKKAKADSLDTDLFLSCCESQTKRIEKSFWYDGEIMTLEFYGVLDNAGKKDIRQKVYKYFNIEADTNIILYAPTFRHKEYDYFNVNFQKLIDAAIKKHGGKWCVILRLHPNIAEKTNGYNFGEGVLNGTYYPEAEDLVYSSEYLISDYSSVLTMGIRDGVKCLAYAPDYENYKKHDQGFYIDIKDMPSVFTSSNEELLYAIEHFDKNKYFQAVSEFIKRCGYVSDKKDLTLLIDLIKKILCGKTLV